MPIIQLDLVMRAGENPPDKRTLQALADEMGQVLGAPAGETWVFLRPLSDDAYVENDMAVPPDIRPAIAHVLQYQRPSESTLARMARGLAGAMARHLNRPEANMHLVFEPDGRGRVAFGGRLVT